MFIYFAMVLAALLLAAISGAALSWDGAYVLLRALDDQTPFVAHRRLISVPLQWPVILASGFTEDPAILIDIFSIAYALVPAVSLWGAWWVVRDRARELFIWPALGIGAGTLSMQFGFISEALMAVQLSWPVVMGILVGLPGRQAPVVLIFAGASLLAHPFGIALSGFAAALGLVYGLRHRDSRQRLWTAAALLAGLTTLASAQFWALRSPYEADQMSYDTLRHAFDTALAGRPIQAIAIAWAAAFLIVAAPALRDRSRLAFQGLALVAVLALAGSGLVLAMWAQDIHSWRSALNARSWLLALTAPFLVAAALDRSLYPRSGQDASDESWRWRLRAIQVTGLSILAVLSFQSAAWAGLSSRLETTLQRSPSVYVPISSLGWIRETPLDVWSTTAHSVLLQGRIPRNLVVGPSVPDEPHLAPGPPIAPWWKRSWDSGWFDMRPLQERLVAEREKPVNCWFVFGEGWYGLEQNGTDWWRWANGTSRLRVHTGSAGSVVFSGGVSSFRQPNSVEVLVNGQQAKSFEVNAPGTQPLEPFSVRLKPGRNTIDLRSLNAAEKPPADDRLLTVAVHSLKLYSQDGLTPCELRP